MKYFEKLTDNQILLVSGLCFLGAIGSLITIAVEIN